MKCRIGETEGGRRGGGSRFASRGRSPGPMSLETEEKVESSVEMELVSITMFTMVKQVRLM